MKLNIFRKALMTMTFLAAQGYASTIMQLSDEEIITRAQYIISGKVESIYTAVEKGNTPFQYITIEVTKIYKNNDERPLYDADKIVLRQMGGTANNVTLEIDSMPKFVEGSEVLANLKIDKNGYYYVVGNSQGLYSMINDRLIRNTQGEGTMFVRHGENGEIRFEPGKISEIGMEQMKARIERAANQAE
jgi:hypothetical protein